jgi:1,5-anhydro-D-fructose reductase (1,5-anhydro-D-mannitol-forming)
MAENVRWAMIGASTIADEWMVKAIRSQPDGAIGMVVSGSAERAAEFARMHGIQSHTTNLDVALADPTITAVYISSTNEKHLQQTLAAADAGKHVLCEKPLALNESDARSMIQACEEAGVVLGTNHHLRCAATHRKLRELVRTGAVGQPLYARVFHAVSLPPHLRGWRIDQADAGGGVTLDISVHDVDTLRFVLDDEPVETTAMTSSGTMSQGGLADGVMGILRFSRGVLAQIHDAFTVPFAHTGLEIHGSEGSLYARDVMTQRPIGEIELHSERGMQRIEVEHRDLYETAVAQFHQAIFRQGTPAATGADGYLSLAAALALATSVESGKRVMIAPRLSK